MRRLGAMTAVATVFVVGVWTTPASAAPPSNDQESGATAIGALPFTTSQDTTEATASGPQFCPTRASVFYSFTPNATGRVQVDTIGSDYDTVLGVYRRTNTGLRAMRCDDDRFGFTSGVRFRAVAGKTYFVMASRCCSNVGGGGGQLELTVTAVTDVVLDYEFDVTGGSVDQGTGLATLEGTLTCNERMVLFRDMSLRQFRDNFFVARGFFGFQSGCIPGVVDQWSVEVDTDTGVAFAPGSATVQSFFEFATDGFTDFVEDDTLPSDQVTLS